ncbi:hypothetical protein B484DRAFT_390286, partial [Ochromonadaceae sp. CCMP2298]
MTFSIFTDGEGGAGVEVGAGVGGGAEELPGGRRPAAGGVDMRRSKQARGEGREGESGRREGGMGAGQGVQGQGGQAPVPTWGNLGTEEQRRRENDMPVSKWSQAPAPPAFSIFEDVGAGVGVGGIGTGGVGTEGEQAGISVAHAGLSVRRKEGREGGGGGLESIAKHPLARHSSAPAPTSASVSAPAPTSTASASASASTSVPTTSASGASTTTASGTASTSRDKDRERAERSKAAAAAAE